MMAAQTVTMVAIVAAALTVRLTGAKSLQYEAEEYLAKFGYLKTGTSGKTAALQSLDSAISDFQAFAGLEQTGELDEETVKMMHTPRCGVKDFVEEDEDTPRQDLGFGFQQKCFSSPLPPMILIAGFSLALVFLGLIITATSFYSCSGSSLWARLRYIISTFCNINLLLIFLPFLTPLDYQINFHCPTKTLLLLLFPANSPLCTQLRRKME